MEDDNTIQIVQAVPLSTDGFDRQPDTLVAMN
jgi:hypothetical protein